MAKKKHHKASAKAHVKKAKGKGRHHKSHSKKSMIKA
jgi:hypothetical protein